MANAQFSAGSGYRADDFFEGAGVAGACLGKDQEGTGFPVEKGGTHFGHPDCNSWASILISRRTGEFIPLLPTDTTTKRLLGQILEKVGGLSLVTDDARTTPWRLAGILAQNPLLAAQSILHLARLILSGRLPWEMFKDLLAGRAHTLGVGTHNFMDAEQVGPRRQTQSSRPALIPVSSREPSRKTGNGRPSRCAG